MKKIFSIACLLLIFFCNGCKVKKYEYDSESNKVPTTIINMTSTGNVENDLSKLYDSTVKSVVTVLNYASYYEKGELVTALYGSGSGFIYSYDENYIYLYTNAHVVSVGKEYNQLYYEIVFYNGYRSYGNLIHKDGSEDVAIMKVSRESQDFNVAVIANSDTVIPGEDIFAIGSPLGLNYCNTITKGIISNTRVEIETDDDGDGNILTMYMLQVDASLNPGNSGGPLFNMKGEVVGVNTLKIMTNDNGENVESFNFSIPSNHFVNVANSLIEKGEYKRPLLGIGVIDINDMSLNERKEKDIENTFGIYIESVSINSASYGILDKGMIIIKINDVEIKDIKDFASELYRYNSGDNVFITTVNEYGKNEVTHNLVLK